MRMIHRYHIIYQMQLLEFRELYTKKRENRWISVLGVILVQFGYERLPNF